MRFVIISHVNHTTNNNLIYGYGPYIREMNLWIKNVDSVEVVANLCDREINKIDLPYKHNNIIFTKLEAFNLTSPLNILKTILRLPLLLLTIFKAMRRADHIHLRCPGNVGLLGCIIQIFFPSIPKTAKYAGNWDPKAKQPWSYKLQKWILNNTFLTKNMKVLVYGEWKGMSKNIKPFFTATYSNNDSILAKNQPVKKLPFHIQEPIKFMFVGTLAPGKRPEYALQLFLEIKKTYNQVTLDFFGEGKLKPELEKFIQNNNLGSSVILHGNQPKEVVEQAYKENHFLILASKSEGWPKVVAEAMFWGCVPLSTNVSCVNQMMGNGERGLMLNMDLNKDVNKIAEIFKNPDIYVNMSNKGKEWSTQYTVDKFEFEIKKII